MADPVLTSVEHDAGVDAEIHSRQHQQDGADADPLAAERRKAAAGTLAATILHIVTLTSTPK